MGSNRLDREVYIYLYINPVIIVVVVCRPDIIDSIENKDFQKWAIDLNGLWKDFGKQVTNYDLIKLESCHYKLLLYYALHCEQVSQSVEDFPDQHSLLFVDNPFIAPGGRFTEFYYW